MERNHTPPRLAGFDYAALRTYFVTFCVRERTPVFANAGAAKLACQEILAFRKVNWYWLYAYCVMPEHVHLLLRKQDAKLSLQTIIATVKRAITFRCRQLSIKFVWQSGFYDRIVRDYETSDEFVKYILMNPVRGGLTAEFDAYPYSGRCDPWK